MAGPKGRNGDLDFAAELFKAADKLRQNLEPRVGSVIADQSMSADATEIAKTRHRRAATKAGSVSAKSALRRYPRLSAPTPLWR